MNEISRENNEYPRLSKEFFNRIKYSKTMTTEEALKDVIPIQWSEEVLSGKKSLLLKKE